MHLSRYRWSTVGLLTICCVLTLPEQSHAQKISFLESVAPLLQNRCLQCHNDSVTEGGLSLATSQDLVDGGYVQPGSPEESDLISLVTPHGAQAEMPKDERPLTGEQIKTLAQWIEEGATWPSDVVLTDPVVSDLDWWSLKPLTRPALPAGNQTTHPVDKFVQAGYTKQGLSPVQTASPENLVRRIYYDLAGLPPTGDEVAAFLQESKTDPEAAWLTLVDRLLASDNFGEKFAHHWLDLARYAETHGYDKDKLRTNAWPYRDYVIASFNADKPYSRFVQEQVAGDVLFPGTPDGIVGLGFLAAGPWDFIGHVEVGEGKQDGRIAKHLDRDEMLAACFNVFMSTTIQCAQCHNHKFDPLTMQDYYEGHAIFAAVDRADRLYTGLSPDLLQERDSLAAELAALKSESNRLAAEAKSRLAPLVADLDPKIKALRDQFGQQPPAQHGYHSQVSKSDAEAKWIQLDFGDVVSIDQIRLRAAFDNYNQIGGGFGFPIRYRVEGSQDPLFQDATVRLLHDASTSDQPNPGLKPVEIAGEGVPVRYLRVTATKLAERKNDFIFALAELEFDIDRDVKTSDGTDDQKLPTAPSVTALDSIESGERWRQINLVDGIFYQELRDASAQQELWRLLEQRDQFVQQVRDPQAELRQTEIQKQAKTLEAKIGQFPEGEFVYAASTQFSPAGQFRSTGGAPRAIHLLHRGDIGSPGDLMHPDGPILWGEASRPFQGIAVTDEQAARGAFAEYLTSPENPLTWRAISNRLVQWTFGKPLVGTPNDFGRMGMLPSHPELLDFLAATLRDDPNHSLKSIIRLLVTSQTYRLAATTDEANADLDADNRYLWQAHRRRLSAEELRDSMLALAGVLQIDQRGGASFQDFVIEKPQHSPHYEYHLHDPLDPRSHRRSIYRFVVRSQPQPMLTTLDCADPSISVPMRDESTTALQALTQWNSRLSIAMADQFAVRLKALEFPTEQAAVQWACQQAWGRAPTEEDLAVLVPLLKVHGGSALGRVLMNSSPFTYIE